MAASSSLAVIQDALDEAKPLGTIRRNVEGLYPVGKSRRLAFLMKHDGLEPLQKRLEELLPDLKTHCEALGLVSIVRGIDFILAHPFRSFEVAKREIARLQDDLKSEMENHLFLFIEPRYAEHFHQSTPLFGDQVAERFPSASHDIAEAGRCFALERHDACVFHSMRILEHGLRTMAFTLMGQVTNPNWHSIIGDMEKEIARRNQNNALPPKWQRGQRDFVAEAALHFRYLKDAWRNHAVHANSTHYDKARSETMLTHTRDFMQHLATKLKQRR